MKANAWFPPRESFLRLVSSSLVDNEVDGGGEASPVGGFGFKLFAAGGGERIELGLAAGFALGPFGLDPALLLEAVNAG